MNRKKEASSIAAIDPDRSIRSTCWLVAVLVASGWYWAGALQALETTRVEPVRVVGLRETNSPFQWEVLDGSPGGQSFEERHRLRLRDRSEIEQTGLAGFFAAVVVGQLADADDYLVGVEGAPGTAGDGGVRPFVIFARSPRLAVAVETARNFARAYAGWKEGDAGEGSAPLDTSCPCEDCGTVLTLELNSCGASQNLCVGAALATGVACAAVCFGNPVCLSACAVATVALLAQCAVDGAACRRAATREFRRCEANCNP